MGINQRLYKSLLLLVGLSMALSGFYMRAIRLEEPVFFQHFMEVPIPEEGASGGGIHLNLGYFTNTADDRRVIGIAFLEAPEWMVMATEHDIRPDFGWTHEEPETYGHYTLRRVFCEIQPSPSLEDMDGRTVTTARVYWSDNTESIVDFGAIHFYRYASAEGLEFSTGSGFSDGISTTRYRALENLELQGVSSPLLESFSHRIELRVNGSDWHTVQGVSVDKDSYMTISAKVLPTEDLQEAYTRFDLHPEITYTLMDGSMQRLRFHNLSSIYHRYSFKDLYRYAKERGMK